MTNPLRGHSPHLPLNRSLPQRKKVSTFTYCWGRGKKITPQKAEPINKFHFQYTKKKKRKIKKAKLIQQQIRENRREKLRITLLVIMIPILCELLMCTVSLYEHRQNYHHLQRIINLPQNLSIQSHQRFGLAQTIVRSQCILWVIKNNNDDKHISCAVINKNFLVHTTRPWYVYQVTIQSS